MSAEIKRKAPAFQFYADDFLSGTITMSNEERGAYIALLCIQWSKGFVSQTDFDRIAMAMPPHSQAICQEKFEKDADGCMRNARLEKERQKQASYRKKQTQNANLRWHGNANPDAKEMPPHMPEACSPSPSPSNTLNHTGSDEDPDVETLRLRIGSWFKRRPTTQWSAKEMKVLKEVIKLKTPPEDIDLLEKRYLSGVDFLRQNPITLMNNWNGEIDKARQKTETPQLFQTPQPTAKKELDLKDWI